MTAIAFEIGLAALLLAIAAWTIVARDTVSAVIAFVVYGLLLALAWVRLSAVDVALTEAAIGSGVTGMLLLGAATRLRPTEAAATSPGAPLCLAAGRAVRPDIGGPRCNDSPPARGRPHARAGSHGKLAAKAASAIP